MDSVFIDPGSSGTKVLASYGGYLHGRCIPPGGRRLKEPLTEDELMEESMADYPFGCGLVEFNGEVWRLGETPMFCHTAALKFEAAIAKTLAVLGSLSCGNESEFRVVLLLPLDEYASRKVFAEQLRQAVSGGAKYNGVELKTVIKEIRVYVEGTGINRQPSGKTASLMIGHSDLSFIVTENGRVNLTESKTFAGAGIGKIFPTLGIPGSDVEVMKALVTNRIGSFAPQLSEAHLSSICNGATTLYFSRVLEPALEVIDWRGISKCYLAGGGARFLRPSLKLPVSIAFGESSKGLSFFGTGLTASRFLDLYWVANRFIYEEIQSRLEPAEAVEVEVV